MIHTNLTKKQLEDLDSLFEIVSKRQLKDFGNISASNKSDGSLITSCDLWSDKTIVEGLSKIAPNEGVLSEEGGKCIPKTSSYWVVDPLDGTTNFAAGIPYWSISVARFVNGRPQSSFLIIPTLNKKFISLSSINSHMLNASLLLGIACIPIEIEMIILNMFSQFKLSNPKLGNL